MKLRYENRSSPEKPLAPPPMFERSFKSKPKSSLMNATISHLNYKEEISAIPDIDDSKSHFLPSEPKDFLASCLGLENPLHLYDVTQLSEKSRVTDEKLIRAGCFNHDGDMFVIGTNTKALFGYSLVPLLESIRPGTGDYS
jgi:hypothetical protein